MKRWIGGAIVGVAVLGAVGVVFAQGMGGYGPRGGMMSWGGGPGGGPCWSGQAGTPASAPAMDEAKARELATEYAGKYLPGYQVDSLSKYDVPRGVMYQVELKGPNGARQTLRINPWGNVRAFGPARAS